MSFLLYFSFWALIPLLVEAWVSRGSADTGPSRAFGRTCLAYALVFVVPFFFWSELGLERSALDMAVGIVEYFQTISYVPIQNLLYFLGLVVLAMFFPGIARISKKEYLALLLPIAVYMLLFLGLVPFRIPFEDIIMRVHRLGPRFAMANIGLAIPMITASYLAVRSRRGFWLAVISGCFGAFFFPFVGGLLSRTELPSVAADAPVNYRYHAVRIPVSNFDEGQAEANHSAVYRLDNGVELKCDGSTHPGAFCISPPAFYQTDRRPDSCPAEDFVVGQCGMGGRFYHPLESFPMYSVRYPWWKIPGRYEIEVGTDGKGHWRVLGLYRDGKSIGGDDVYENHFQFPVAEIKDEGNMDRYLAVKLKLPVETSCDPKENHEASLCLDPPAFYRSKERPASCPEKNFVVGKCWGPRGFAAGLETFSMEETKRLGEHPSGIFIAELGTDGYGNATILKIFRDGLELK